MKNKALTNALKNLLMGTGITILSNIESIISFVERIIPKSQTNEVVSSVVYNSNSNDDLYRIIGIIVTFALSMLVIGYIMKIKKDFEEKMVIQSMITYKRTKDIVNFINGAKHDDYIQILHKEFIAVRLMILRQFNNKTQKQITEIMLDYYPNELREMFKDDLR